MFLRPTFSQILRRARFAEKGASHGQHTGQRWSGDVLQPNQGHLRGPQSRRGSYLAVRREGRRRKGIARAGKREGLTCVIGWGGGIEQGRACTLSVVRWQQQSRSHCDLILVALVDSVGCPAPVLEHSTTPASPSRFAESLIETMAPRASAQPSVGGRRHARRRGSLLDTRPNKLRLRLIHVRVALPPPL